MADLIPYTTEQILDLFKSAYYEQTGNPLLIGSDEFAFSTVAAYVLRVFEQAMKRGADAVSINTATGEALDNIAASFGITRSGATA
jgi:phage-related baseplate assembly protein